MDDATRRTLTYHQAARKNIAGLVSAHSLQQLNRVPEGLNNNLIWNAGHVVATCELLTYGLARLPLPSGNDFVNRYRKGTRPEGAVEQAEVDVILEALMTGHVRLSEDLDRADWSGYTPYATSFGVTLNSIVESVAFNNMHETLHLGTMLALRRLV